MPTKYIVSNTVNKQNGLNELYRQKGRIYPAQSSIYHQGDKFSGFYRVNSGVVMVYRLLENSQRQISGFFTAGEFFGLSGMDDYLDSAVTVATSNVVRISMAMVQSHPELQQKLFQESCAQLNAAQSLITTLTKKTASQKIAQFLVNLSEREVDKSHDFDVRLPMSRLDIADYLGLTIETVSRRLTALKSAGLISLPNRDTVRIKNFGQLHEMVGAQ